MHSGGTQVLLTQTSPDTGHGLSWSQTSGLRRSHALRGATAAIKSAKRGNARIRTASAPVESRDYTPGGANCCNLSDRLISEWLGPRAYPLDGAAGRGRLQAMTKQTS